MTAYVRAYLEAKRTRRAWAAEPGRAEKMARSDRMRVAAHRLQVARAALEVTR